MKWIKPIDDLEKWHEWFAWYPVTVKIYPDGQAKKVIWLEKVLRCGKFHLGMCSGYWTWKYKELGK